MNDSEFDVMDELYFVISYHDLEKALPSMKKELKDILKSLILKGWVKCLKKESDEEIFDLEEYNLNYEKYNYLSTKAGLLAHNSK